MTFPYMNPVVLQVLNQWLYKSPTSIVRRSHDLYHRFPSLYNDFVVGQWSFEKELPTNGFVLAAVAVSFW